MTYNYYGSGKCNPANWYNGTDYTDLTWTQGRRLSSITKYLTGGVRTYDYAYDMSGVRSSKTIEITVDGVLRNRRYDYITQNGKVVRETAYYTDGGEEFMHCLDFFYDENGHPFAMRKYTDETLSSYNTYYYILNAQGDVVKLIAPSGNVYAEYSYDAWGNILDSSGSLRNTNPLRYRGYYFDKETGFYYLQSRYYDPALGRFLNADSYASTGQGFLGYNMFAYCGNDPVCYEDQKGLNMNVCLMATDSGSKTKEQTVEYEFLDYCRANNIQTYYSADAAAEAWARENREASKGTEKMSYIYEEYGHFFTLMCIRAPMILVQFQLTLLDRHLCLNYKNTSLVIFMLLPKSILTPSLRMDTIMIFQA